MIPAILHTVWPSGTDWLPNDQPDLTHFDQFAAIHDGWRRHVWTDPADVLDDRFLPLLPQIRNIASVSDIMRYSALLRHGGVYVDCDVVPLRSLAPLTTSDAFAGWEDEHRLCNAVMGFVAGHPGLDAFVDYLVDWMARHILQTDPPFLTGPQPFTEFWRTRDDIVRLPPISFYPFHYTEKALIEQWWQGTVAVPAESYAVHEWHAGWRHADDQRP